MTIFNPPAAPQPVRVEQQQTVSTALASGTKLPDPLEQFEVVAVAPDFTILTNLALILVSNIGLIYSIFSVFSFSVKNNYDYVIRSIYQLVRSMVKENLYIKKQQYFAVLFYLFITLLLANLIGLLPFSFTVTSSFILTFFLALIHFLGVNIIAASEHR